MKVSVLALAAAISCTGCMTNKPLMPQAERYPVMSQKKPMAVQHWGAIASMWRRKQSLL